jgi:DsbC/DsbD-like thiol-disulfide interchange protein
MHHRFAALTLLGAMAITAGPVPARATDTVSWRAGTHSQVRLIAGTNAPRQPVLRAGIDIALAPGWKTYWRYPGDSGVPPRFDFTASGNVRSVDVLWPAPERMADGGGQSIGYLNRVIMPLRVVPKDPSRPAVLDLKLSYAVCEKLCIPAEAAARLTLAPATSLHEAALAAAEARVPQPAKLGEAGPLAVRAVRRVAGAGKPRVVVDLAAPEGVAVDLFAEGPTPAWALPLPEAKGTAAGSRQFVFELDGLPAGAQAAGAELTLTLVAGAAAIEVKTRLD